MQFNKLFTPEEATRTLPLVRRIVADILSAAGRFRDAVRERNVPEHAPELTRLKNELNSYFHELKELGCEYKDYNFEVGLVDFPAVINDEIVLLCWRSDEPELLYYHGLEEGFAGRLPIPGKTVTAEVGVETHSESQRSPQ